MTIVGLYLVRNEIDILEVNLRHHLATAMDAALVVDNGSTDGTLDLLLRLARELPITVASEPGKYDQAALVTRMARQAVRQGATWLLPIDADEFWTGTTTALRDILLNCPEEVGVLRCEVINFVQRREELAPTQTCLLTMTMRVADTCGTVAEAEELVESGEIGFVEMAYPKKCISRASSRVWIHRGNHAVDGIDGDRRATDAILCLHAPLRARAILSTKADQGRRLLELGDLGPDGWHVRRWWRLAQEGSTPGEWAANSYKDGALSVGGDAHVLVNDERLRRAVTPFVTSTRRAPRVPFRRLRAKLASLDPLEGID